MPAILRFTALVLLALSPLGAQTTIKLEHRLVRLEGQARVGTALDPAQRVLLVRFAPEARPDRLEGLVEALRPVGGGVWLARLPEGQSAVRLASDPAVACVAPFRPGDRPDRLVVAALAAGEVPGWARSDAGAWRLSVALIGGEADADPARAWVRQIGGSLPEAGVRYGGHLAVELAPDLVPRLCDGPWIARVELADPPREVCNIVSQSISSVDLVQEPPYSLDGDGVRVGIWDGGRAASHGDYAGRRTNEEPGTTSGHCTHVTGTILGDGSGNPAAEGMAPQALAHVYNFNGDVAAEMDGAVTGHGIVASNNSWGIVMGWYWSGVSWQTGMDEAYFGAYTSSESGAIDEVVENNPGLLILFAAGNDRWEGPAGQEDGTLAPDGELYDLIDPFGVAKNILTIGALTDDGVTPTGFSSFGPADDGRVKPELMANGEALLSTYLSGGYTSMSGTSMACPSATGAVADLVQWHRLLHGGASPDADLLRAILVTTSTDLHLPGPDARTGFGRLEARFAADLMALDADPALQHVLHDSISETQVQEHLFDVPAGTDSLRMTLSWIDPPGSGAAMPAAVQDLDLTLVEPGSGALHHPWKLDAANPHLAATRGANPVDILEQVVVDDPVPGSWVLRVTGTTVAGTQPYVVVSRTNLGTSTAMRLVGGRITECGLPVAGVPVELEGAHTDRVLTSSSGEYVFQVTDGSYTVVPHCDTHLLTPVQQVVTLTGGDRTDLDFQGQRIGAGTGTCSYLQDEVPDLAIPDDDPVGVVSSLTVPDSFLISDLQVRVQITHTFRGDLRVILRAPGGSPSATLWVPDGGNGLDDLHVTFDTQMPSVDPLDVFDGVDALGTWELEVSDNFAVDTGTLDEWELLLGCPPATPPAISIGALPDATESLAYSSALAATAGSPPYVWSVVGGSLPPGVSLTGSGSVQGTPTTAGSYAWTARVEDALGLCDARLVTLQVLPAGPTVSGVCGDCDDSGQINILDALLASRIDSGLASLLPGTLAQCDVTGGGVISVLDALQIARYVVALAPALVCAP